MTEIDRTSTEAAEGVLKTLLPEGGHRKVALRLLAHAIKRAEKARPGCWSVTLKPKVIRVNVGKVEVLAIHPEAVRFIVSIPAGQEPTPTPTRLSPYASIPNSAMYIVDADFAEEAWQQLGPQWDRAIAAAADSAKRSPWAYAHSPGVIELIRREVDPEVPQISLGD